MPAVAAEAPPALQPPDARLLFTAEASGVQIYKSVAEAGGAPHWVLQAPLARLTGRIEDLLTDPAHEALSEAWLQVTLTDTALPYEAMARLRQRFSKTLDMRHVPAGIPAQATDSPTYRERVRGRGDVKCRCSATEGMSSLSQCQVSEIDALTCG